MKRWLASSLLVLVGVGFVLPAGSAYAHGEKAQESFLRTRTIAWLDVKFSTDEQMQGEELVITGSFYLLENFPEALEQPIKPNGKAYLNLLSAGPTHLVKERSIGGEQQTQTVTLDLGKIYDFKLVGIARRVGRWHAHPVLHVKGAGPLLGPGRFITVNENPAGFANNVKLANGTTVNLETFGFWGVVWWQALMFLVGAAWIAYWLIPSPIIGRLAFTVKGKGDSLITDKQKRVSVVFGVVTLLMVGAGFVISKVNNPQQIPPQVRRDFPKASANFASLVTADKVERVTYDKPSRTMEFDVTVKNPGTEPVTLRDFTTANTTWDNTSVVTGRLQPFHYPMSVSPSPGVIGPGETVKFRIKLSDEAWEEQRLISVGEVSSRIGGVLYFSDGQGRRQVHEVDAEILPSDSGVENVF